jgi:LPXTG-motif cell wall-anchored protein
MTYPKKIGAVVLALVLSLVGLALAAGPAQAVVDPAVKFRGDDPCAPAVVVAYGFQVVPEKWAPWLVVHDGTELHVLKLITGEGTISLNPEAGPTTIRYRVFGGGESDNHLPTGGWQGLDDWIKSADGPGSYDALTADSLLAAPLELFKPWRYARRDGCVTPGEPTSNQLECAAATAPTVAGTIEIPDTEGVQYLLDGEPIEAGTHELAPGTYTVTAEPEPGYAFPPEFKPEWTFTLGAINGCPGTPGLPGNPGADGQDGTDGDDGISSVATGSGGELPKTSSGIANPGLLAIGAALLLLFGGLAYGLNRVRRVTFTAG